MKLNDGLRINSAFLLVQTLFCCSAFACPDGLIRLHTDFLPKSTSLCQLYDRYQAALNRKGESVADVVAPRLINLPDWEAAKQKKVFDPRQVYKPVPGTWNQWQTQAEKVDAQAAANLRSGKPPTLSIDWLEKMHGDFHQHGTNRTDASDLTLRRGNEVGLALDHKAALNPKELDLLYEFESAVSPNSISLREDTGCKSIPVAWHPAQCVDDRTRSFFLRHDPHHSNSRGDFLDEDGNERECGYFSYPPASEVMPNLRTLLQGVNSETSTWHNSKTNSDPILLAAKLERSLIMIHPYSYGNGRVSRFAMEYLLESLGLPPPILKDMDDDIVNDDRSWAKQVGDGMLRTVSTLEACLQHPDRPECRTVPKH